MWCVVKQKMMNNLEFKVGTAKEEEHEISWRNTNYEASRSAHAGENAVNHRQTFPGIFETMA